MTDSTGAAPPTAEPERLRIARDAWNRSFSNPPPGAFDLLAARYMEDHRHYHVLEHPVSLVEISLDFHDEVSEVDFIAWMIAVWWHDAVYAVGPDVLPGWNEARSADLMTTMLVGHFHANTIDVAHQMIMATTIHESSYYPTRLFLDADLSILAADPDVYLEYVKAVRREYSHVSDPAWALGRGDVLRGLLKRPAIFLTDAFRHGLEETARLNIARELMALDMTPIPSPEQ